MSMPAIRVEGLWKQYQVGGRERPPESFREAVTRAVAAPFRRLAGRAGASQRDRWFWALQDVTFTVELGEVVGIIGRNGAGKTTLLKVLSRITPPTRGRAEVRGRLGSLLEVGTGFHPELTGRENIYLNGAILGMKRAEIRCKFDEIVAFAEVERFLDTPVKRYSSGMAVRLAFSIAAHLDPEILLVDEVLAVGDARFQRKCLGKMDEVSREGRTVLFVSHNLAAISKLCGRGLVLGEGRLLVSGNTSEALRAYSKEVSGSHDLPSRNFFGPLTGKLQFRGVSINGLQGDDDVRLSPSEAVRIAVWGASTADLPSYRTTVSIYKDGQLVISRHDAAEPDPLPRGDFESEVVIPPYFLSPGEYWVEFGGYTTETGAWTWSRDQVRFHVIDEWSKEYDTLSNMGVVNLPDAGRRVHRG